MSVPRIDASGCGYWRTPNTMDGLAFKTDEALAHEMTHRPGRSEPNNLRDQLAVREGLRSWPTPKGTPSGPDFARTNRKGSGGDDLATRVARGGATRQTWATPNVCGGGNPPGIIVPHKGHYLRPSGAKAHLGLDQQAQIATQTSGSLNPTWVEWLMGWPRGWTDSGHSVTDRCLTRWLRRGRCWLAGLGY